MNITISKAVSVGLMLFGLGAVVTCLAAESGNAPTEKTFDAPHGLKVSIKMIGPYAEPADLQIICLFKHKASGDTYQGAAKDTDDHLHGILSALRNRGEFVGRTGKHSFYTTERFNSGKAFYGDRAGRGKGSIAGLVARSRPNRRARSGSTECQTCCLGACHP